MEKMMSAFIETEAVPQTFGGRATELQSATPGATQNNKEQHCPNIDAILFAPDFPP